MPTVPSPSHSVSLSGTLCPGRTSLDLKKPERHLLLEMPNVGGDEGLASCCSPPEAFFTQQSHVVNAC